MRKCKSCDKPITIKQIHKSIWAGYKPIYCEDCKLEHSITNGSRTIFVSVTLLPMLIFGLYLQPFENGLLNLLVSFIILIIGSLIAPYLVQYRKTKP